MAGPRTSRVRRGPPSYQKAVEAGVKIAMGSDTCITPHALGSLEPGKRADVVLVEGDPFEFEGLRERIRAVYKDGRCVHRAGVAEAADRDAGALV